MKNTREMDKKRSARLEESERNGWKIKRTTSDKSLWMGGWRWEARQKGK